MTVREEQKVDQLKFGVVLGETILKLTLVFEAKSIKDLKTVLKYNIKSLSKNTILLEISDMSLVIIAFCLFLLATKLGDKKF